MHYLANLSKRSDIYRTTVCLVRRWWNAWVIGPCIKHRQPLRLETCFNNLVCWLRMTVNWDLHIVLIGCEIKQTKICKTRIIWQRRKRLQYRKLLQRTLDAYFRNYGLSFPKLWLSSLWFCFIFPQSVWGLRLS